MHDNYSNNDDDVKNDIENQVPNNDSDDDDDDNYIAEFDYHAYLNLEAMDIF